jgi:hypothetical protein
VQTAIVLIDPRFVVGVRFPANSIAGKPAGMIASLFASQHHCWLVRQHVCWQTAGSVWPWAAPAVAELVIEQPCAEVDAFVADRAGWSGDDLLDVAGGFAAEGAASELAAEFARVIVGEMGGDLPGGVGELLVGQSAGFRVGGVGVVEGGSELVKGAVQELPGGDGESWAVAV